MQGKGMIRGPGADTTTAGVGAAAVTATDIGVARLTNPTGRPLPLFMTAPTAAAGVYCAPPASSGTDAEIGVAFSGRSRLPSGPYFLGLPRFLFPSPLPAATAAADTGLAGGGGVVSGAGAGAGCAASAAAGEASVVAIVGSSLNTTFFLVGPEQPIRSRCSLPASFAAPAAPRHTPHLSVSHYKFLPPPPRPPLPVICRAHTPRRPHDDAHTKPNTRAAPHHHPQYPA
nr:unnamed protein product [Digitaria exilis]